MKLSHPETDRVRDVSDDAAPMWLSQGWREVTPPKKKKSPAGSTGDEDRGTAPHTTTTEGEGE